MRRTENTVTKNGGKSHPLVDTEVIVQVRMGSTRLPGKAIRQLGGEALFLRVLDALGHIRGARRIIAAMPGNSLEALAPLAESRGCEVFVGSEEDVLGRFARALEVYPARHVIRATADNPFTDAALADAILKQHIRAKNDLSHFLGIPPGSGVEVIRGEALLKAAGDASLAEEREHVTPYIYAHRERFRVAEPRLDDYPELRLTVDTHEDLLRAERIWQAGIAASAFTLQGKSLPLEQIVALYKEQPALFT